MDVNFHRFALRAIKGELLEGKEREKERDSFGILYTGFLLSIVKIKRDRDERREREREIKHGRFRQKQHEKSLTEKWDLR